MLEPDPSSERRELIRRLPELLEGDEPLFARPAVQAYLARHPEARRALLAAERWTELLDEEEGSAAPHRPASLGAAHESLRERLVDQLFAIVRHEYLASMRHAPAPRGHCLELEEELSARELERAHHEVEQLALVLGVRGSEGRILAVAAETEPSVERVQRALALLEQLRPEAAEVRIWRHWIDERLGRRVSSRQLLAVAEQAAHDEARSRALNEAARHAADEGRPLLALELAEQAARLRRSPNVAGAFNALRYALRARNRPALRAFAAALSRECADTLRATPVLDRMIRADLVRLQGLLKAWPEADELLERELPRVLYETLREGREGPVEGGIEAGAGLGAAGEPDLPGGMGA